MTDNQKIEDAIGLIVQYGGVDGAHHKAWVIDQVLRILAGDEYDELIRTICAGDDGPDTYEWDKGIVP
jgi:hypothetical protein